MKRLLAIAAILCLAQPVQANPHLAVKFAQLHSQVTSQYPRESELIKALAMYQQEPCAKWLCYVVKCTINSDNPQLHTLLDGVLLEVEATIKEYLATFRSMPSGSKTCTDYTMLFNCVFTLPLIESYITARARRGTKRARDEEEYE